MIVQDVGMQGRVGEPMEGAMTSGISSAVNEQDKKI